MKKLKALAPIMLLGIAISGMTGCNKQTQSSQSPEPQPTNSSKVTQYYCPMHPEIVRTSAGKCPKCGMDLVEKQ